MVPGELQLAMSKKITVTGGAGFIGTNLCEYLVAEGYDVHVIDNLSAGKKERLPDEVTFHELDIRQTDEVKDIVVGSEAIVHLAAEPSVQFSIENPEEVHDVNVNGTLSVLEAARKSIVNRVVFASSSAIYGNTETLPHSIDLVPSPESPYALSKLMGEQLLKMWSDLYELQTVSFRFFNVYGPHFDPNGAYAAVVGKFLEMKKEGKPYTITGDGEQTRDFVHVKDLSNLISKAVTSATVGNGEIFNVGTGSPVSVNEMAKMLGGEVTYLPERKELKHSLADISETKEVFDWEPEITFAEGLKELEQQITD